jgi:hypothetical protein
LAPDLAASGLIVRSRMHAPVACVEGAKMLDAYIVREQVRAAAQWRASCASDDALKQRIAARGGPDRSDGSATSDGVEVNARKCGKCGRARASMTKREGRQTRVYYQCLVCDPCWSSRPATDISIISTYFPAPSHAPPPGAPVAGP